MADFSAPHHDLTSSVPAVRLRYFLRIPNVGDRINPLIVSELASSPTQFCRGDELPHLLCVGSLLAAAEPSSIVWGTGLMHPDLGLGRATNANIHALRGKLSAVALQRAGMLTRDVPLGDPGLLAPRLLGITASNTPRHRLGVAAHYVDRRHPAVARLLALPGVLDLDVRKNPTEFLLEMASCEAIASSSLHGLIFAEALGLPSLWFVATDDVAGAGFKFRDWFTTTTRPQESPHRLDGRDHPESLARQAEPRGVTTSVTDLIASFPRHRLDEVRQQRPCRVSVATSRRASHPLPVFIISFNRGQLLLKCLAGLRRLTRPTVPVIHDNGSNDPATLRILASLEADGVTVQRCPAISSPEELDGIDRTITGFFAHWAEPTRYAVTDCDVDMSAADPGALEVYDELLDTFRGVDCVGPMLRIRDIPSSYPLYGRVMNRHIEQFWHRRPAWVETGRGRVAVQECLIDTTFALHRAGEPFRRLKSAVRVYEPYEAIHLDWYDDARSLDALYAETSAPQIAHWNNSEEFQRHRDEPLHYRTFYAVRRTPHGSLEEYICPIEATG